MVKQVAQPKTARNGKPQPLSRFALTQTRVRLKRVAREIERATRHPRNPETAHDLRVAIRRFTQCLRTFEELLDPGPVKKMRKKLRKLMDLCGAKRDYDVGLQVLADAGLPADHPAFARFQEQRDQAMRDLAHALQKKHKWAVADRWRKQLTRRKRLRVLHPTPPEAQPPTVAWTWTASVEENARRILPQVADDFFRDGEATVAARGDESLLHPLRLRGKRFRYTLEVFVPGYGEALESKLRDLRGLQDRMGQINDCMVVLKLSGMNRAAAAAVRKLLAVRDAAFRAFWHKTFSSRSQESWKRLLSSPGRTRNHGPKSEGLKSGAANPAHPAK